MEIFGAKLNFESGKWPQFLELWTSSVCYLQLINLIGNDYVVWDKSANIQFKAPAKEDIYGVFSYSVQELENIKQRVAEENEIELNFDTICI